MDGKIDRYIHIYIYTHTHIYIYIPASRLRAIKRDETAAKPMAIPIFGPFGIPLPLHGRFAVLGFLGERVLGIGFRV